MLIRFFIYSNNKKNAKEIFEDCISCILNCIIERKEQKVEPYWKFSDMYVVEEILKVNISIDSFESFLKSISDKWLRYGFPVTDELLN